MIKNKKGDLTGETLNLVITIFCILLILIPLAILLYKTFIYNKEKEVAKAILDNIEAQIKFLLENGIKNKTITIEKAGGWEIRNGIEVKYDKCNGDKQKCLCVCERRDEKCNKGICVSLDIPVSVYPWISLNSPKEIIIKIKKDKSMVIIEEK